jgi:UDP-N-acetylglucosamine enolpyruvyl transferase
MGIMCQIARAEVWEASLRGGAGVCTISGYVSNGVTRCVVLRVLGRGYRVFSARIGTGLCRILHADFREVFF